MQEANPLYDWGQRVVVVDDLWNDGSYPEAEPEALLVKQGEIGEVVQVGRHEDAGVFVYKVEFSENRVIGCIENEIKLWEGAGEKV